MKYQRGFIGPDFDKMIVVILIVAAFGGYGIIRGVEWVFSKISVEVTVK